MFRNRLFNILKSTYKYHKINVATKIRNLTPVTIGILTTASCSDELIEDSFPFEEDSSEQMAGLDHEFLIRQATTVNVNSATQLLTVTVVAIQDTSEKLRDALTKEICLLRQALEWGDGTPPQHWDQIVAIRGSLSDLSHNVRILFSYMEYAEKLATVVAEISYLSGNIVASDAICERIDHANRVCQSQKQLTQTLQQESLELQQQAIISSPQNEEKLKDDKNNKKKPKHGGPPHEGLKG